MGKSLSTELKQYTFNLLILIGKEVDQQFAKWNKPNIGFLAKYVAAHSKAADHQTETLKDYEDEKRKTLERTLFIIELVSIPAVSWLGAALELRVGAKLFSEYKDGFAAETGKYFYKKVHDEFKSKIFGDSGKDLAGTIFKLAGDKVFPTEPPEVNINNISSSPDFDTFGNNLYLEVDKQNTAAQTNINKIAQSVNNSATFGDSVVKKLRATNAGFDRMVYEQQYNLGTRMINDLLQANRTAWASSWLYYGADPPQPDWNRIARELERQIWCIWIIQQDLHSERRGWGLFTEDFQVVGESGNVFDSVGGVAASYKTSPIENRLFEEFNAPLMDYEMDYALKAHTKRWADEQAQKIRQWAGSGDFSYLKQQLAGRPRQLKPIDQLF